MSLPTQKVEIDPRGDFFLHVSSEIAKYHLRVSSKALCLASPVFREMLEPAPNIREGQAAESATSEFPFEMNLEHDNYGALLIVLNAVHYRVRKIPKSLSLDEFYQLAILCDKYELAEILVPWVNIWKSKLGNVPGGKSSYGRWFVIAWVFRLSKTFEAVTKEMIYDVSLSSSSVTLGDCRVEPGAVPGWVFESFRDVQRRMASHLLAVAAKEFDRFKSCLETGSNVCEVTYKSGNINLSCPDRNACDANALGGLVRCLFVAGLWPITLETTSNIRTILSAFASMKTISRYLPQDPSSTAHDLCGSGLPLQVEAQAVHTAIKGLNLSDFYLLDEIFFPIDDEEPGPE